MTLGTNSTFCVITSIFFMCLGMLSVFHIAVWWLNVSPEIWTTNTELVWPQYNYDIQIWNGVLIFSAVEYIVFIYIKNTVNINRYIKKFILPCKVFSNLHLRSASYRMSEKICIAIILPYNIKNNIQIIYLDKILKQDIICPSKTRSFQNTEIFSLLL